MMDVDIDGEQTDIADEEETNYDSTKMMDVDDEKKMNRVERIKQLEKDLLEAQSKYREVYDLNTTLEVLNRAL